MNKKYIIMGIGIAMATLVVSRSIIMKEKPMNYLTITSPSFGQGEEIPQKFTCEGENVSPALRWHGIPEQAKSIVLICDDPDAPSKTWVHWVVFNLQPTVHELPENARISRYAGAVEGKNSSDKNAYSGPCPPEGTHRYFFKLYALDVILPLHSNAKKEDVEQEMKGHIIGQGQLMGTYRKKN